MTPIDRLNARIAREHYVRAEAGRQWDNAASRLTWPKLEGLRSLDGEDREREARRLIAENAVSIAEALADALGLVVPEEEPKPPVRIEDALAEIGRAMANLRQYYDHAAKGEGNATYLGLIGTSIGRLEKVTSLLKED